MNIEYWLVEENLIGACIKGVCYRGACSIRGVYSVQYNALSPYLEMNFLCVKGLSVIMYTGS